MSFPGVARAGIVAGLIGAVAIDVYLLAVYVLIAHAVTFVAFFQYVASGAIGKAAYGDPAFAWLGLAMHVAVSIGWGIGFAYVAARTPQVRARPFTSGIVFGGVVMLAMWLIEFAAAIWQFPTVATFEHALVAHMFFFGLPVAYVASRELGRA